MRLVLPGHSPSRPRSVPAQAFSNYLKQHIKQAERDIIFEEFEQRRGTSDRYCSVRTK